MDNLGFLMSARESSSEKNEFDNYLQISWYIFLIAEFLLRKATEIFVVMSIKIIYLYAL